MRATMTPEQLAAQLKKDAEKSGYFLNPDEEFVLEIADGILKNSIRYGYNACPCRLCSGNIDDDIDLICPCDYRDSDLNDFGACFCGLYVAKDVHDGKQPLTAIPDRRMTSKASASPHIPVATEASASKYPVWRCKVCGYLCARDNPPDICPICKVQRERFEIFLLK